MNRRQFISYSAGLSLFGASLNAFALPLSRIIGPGSPAYLQEFHKRYWAWIASQEAIQTKELPVQWHSFITACINEQSLWGSQTDTWLWPHIQYEYRIGEKTPSLGLCWWGCQNQSFMKQWSQKLGVNSSKDIFALGWDFDSKSPYFVNIDRDSSICQVIAQDQTIRYQWRPHKIDTDPDPPILPYNSLISEVMVSEKTSSYQMGLRDFSHHFLPPSNQNLLEANLRAFNLTVRRILFENGELKSLFYPT